MFDCYYIIINHNYQKSQLNATFKIISVRSRRSVVLLEETGVPGENHRKNI